MSDQQEIRFRVIVDDGGVLPAVQRTDKGLAQIGTSAQQSSRQTQAAMRMLPAQLSDVATQLAGGQSPFLVLMQQGLQTRDMFGSFSAAGRGLLSVLTPTTLAVGGLTGALGLLGYAAFSGYEQASRLTKAIELTGGAAGRSVGQIDTMSRSLATATGAGIGIAREAMEGLAATGAFVGTNLDVAGRAVVAMQRLTGQSASEVVKHLAGMRDGVSAWSVASNRAWNFLNADQVRAIRQFEAQGRAQDAARVALTALAETMEVRADRALGSLERAWNGVKAAASGAWDAMLDVGRERTLDQKIEDARIAVENAARRGSEAPSYNAATGRMMSGGADQLKSARTYLDALLKQREGERQASDGRVADAEKARREIEEQSRAGQDGLLAIERAGAARRLAQEINAETEWRQWADQAYRQRAITAIEYTAEIIDTERRKIEAQERFAARELDLVKARKADTPNDVRSNAAAEQQAQQRLEEVLSQRRQFEERVRAGAYWVGPDAGTETAEEIARGTFRRAELMAEGYAQAEAFMADRRRSAMEAASELRRTNRSLSADLIQDDRARAFAQLDIEAQELARRMDMNSLYGEDRKRVEDDFSAWRQLRERQLTEELKPEWQRQVELWADTQRDMRQRYDTFMSGWLDGGRSTFAEWLRTGKASGRDLVSFLRSQFASLIYDRYLSGLMKQAGDGLLSWVFGSDSLAGSVIGTITGGSGLKLPGRAGGGRVDAGGAYVVGEQGPEVLRMGAAAGWITPNHALPAAASAGPSMSLSVGDGQTINVGSQVSRADVVAAVRQGNAAVLADVRRMLRQQGLL